MPHFRKRPVVIEARQLTEDPDAREDVMVWVNRLSFAQQTPPICTTAEGGALNIVTLEGTHRADVGDWVIKGVKGEFYPRKPDIFDATYEPAEPPASESRPPPTGGSF